MSDKRFTICDLRSSIRLIVLICIFMVHLFPVGLHAQKCPENGISQDEFAARRRALMMKADTGAAIVMRSKDASGEYEMMHYRQELNFLYLTGIKEPGICLLLFKKGIDIGGSVKTTVFFASAYADLNKDREKFSNGTDTLLNTDEFRKIFNQLAGKIPVLYYSAPDLGFANDWLNDSPYFILTEAKKKLKQRYPGLKIKDVSPLVAAIRQVKSPSETGLTRQAIRVTGDGILAAMKACKAGMMEYELQAAIEYAMTRQGAESTAFNSIIGSGENSLILHYDRNNCELKNGDIVVMDVGALYKGYAADVTRTIPVSGKFTKEQKEIYNVVLAAHDEAIRLIRPGLPASELDKKASEVIARGGYKAYIRHGITHPVGLDVHDVSSGDTLVEGMIITIEPGIYIPVNDEKLPAAYHGFGIRIEDDVLVTADGYEVLSGDIPGSAEEIEKIMK